MKTCDVCWGSHGCDKPEGHEGMHWCGGCCSATDPTLTDAERQAHTERHRKAGQTHYGIDGCAGTWPFYGRKSMAGPDAPLPFFHALGGHDNMPDEFERMYVLQQTSPEPWADVQ